MAGAIARERRAVPRVPAVSIAGLERARLRPGRTAHIIDLSASGMFIETDWRLLPGTRVEMQLGEPVPLFRVSGRVLRCHVSLVGRERVRYRGALMFDEHLTSWEVSTHGVWSGPAGT